MQFEYRMKDGGGRPNTMWVTSLADLLALLLAFFVLLFSMNEVKDDSWREILDTLGYELNDQLKPVEEDGHTADKNTELFTEQKAFDLDYLENILGEKIRGSQELKDVTVFKADDRLIISFIGETYFNPGAEQVSDALQDGVRILGESLRYVKNRIEVYGHTDPSQAATPVSLMQSNWGLSLARALAVADSLTRAGYGYPIRAFGMADARYHELQNVTDKEKRFSLSRRVDIVIREAEGEGRNG